MHSQNNEKEKPDTKINLSNQRKALHRDPRGERKDPKNLGREFSAFQGWWHDEQMNIINHGHNDDDEKNGEAEKKIVFQRWMRAAARLSGRNIFPIWTRWSRMVFSGEAFRSKFDWMALIVNKLF